MLPETSDYYLKILEKADSFDLSRAHTWKP